MAEAGTFRIREIAVPAYGPTVVAAVGTGAVAPIIALSARDLGASVGVAAFAVGLSLVAELFLAMPAGSLIGRVGERRAMVGAALVDAVVSLAAWLAPSLPMFLAAMFGLGFTNSVFLVARQGYLIEAVPYAARARAMSTLGGVNRIGLFVGPFIAAPIVQRWGPQSGFTVAVVAGVCAALLVLLARDITAEHDRAVRRAACRSTANVLWSERKILSTVGIGVLFIGAVRAARTSVVPLWAEHVGLTASQVALIFGVAGGLEMLLFWPAGSIMDRFGRVYVALPCVGTLALAFFLLPHTQTLVGVGLVTILASVGNGLGAGIVMTLGADNAPADGRPQFLGGWRFLSVIGGSSAPLVIGLVATAASLAAACVTMGAVGLAGSAWLGVVLPRNDPRRQQASTSGPRS